MTGLVLYMNGERGRLTLEKMLKQGHEVSTVILPANSNMKSILETKKPQILEVSKCNENDFITYMRHLGPELAIVAGFPQILSNELLSIPKKGTINQHGGKLPEYRGGSPLNWQIINGESKIGISIIKMDSGIDTGDLIYETSFSLRDDEDISDAHRKANELFAELSIRAIEAFEDDSITYQAQNNENAIYWHQRNINDGLIHWDRMLAREVINLVRALTHPYPGAFTFINSDKVKVFSASLPAMAIKGVPGRVCYIQGEGPFVVCSDRAVLLKNYVIENQTQSDIDDSKLKTGDQLEAY